MKDTASKSFILKFERFSYKWLPIVFGCHCRPDRSFFYKGRQFPICARCTGLLIGFIAGVLSAAFWMVPVSACLVLMIPLVLDVLLQRFTRYESTNIRRLVTGILFGYSAALLLIVIYGSALKLGYRIGKEHFGF